MSERRSFENAFWVCPVCRAPLTADGGSFRCPDGHCYDISGTGYVNLLRSSSAGNHGDDRLMVRARREFLDRGFYAPLADALSALAAESAGPGDRILDAGCGEGYYTRRMAAASGAVTAGVDVSKAAVAAAAKRDRSLLAAVASAADLPVGDGSVDLLTSVFAPVFAGEFRRVLRPGGRLIRVVPGERHLWELKTLVYDRPYENPAPVPELEGFCTESIRRVEYELALCDNAALRQLFMMTPYYYKTGRADQAKLEAATELTTRVEFVVIVHS